MNASLSTLTRGELLARLHELVRRGNAVEAELLAHLAEVDARRLHVEEGCPSLFAYCQRVLRFAEGVAYKRIQVARAARRHPEILAALRRGELHVTGVSLLAPHLDAENARELIRTARHRSADEIRRLLADRAPKPGVPASVRREPTSVPPSTVPAPIPAAPTSERPAPLRPTPAPPPPARPRTEPLGGERYHVQFTADRELYEQLQELKALMRHQIPDGDVGKILGRAVGLLLKEVRRRKFAETSAPRPPATGSDRRTRHIPAAIRRAVWQRDGGRCTYVSAGGRRCGAREFLEFDHADGWARARAHSVDRITLRCRAHNQLRARRDFGDRHMARFRRARAQLDSDQVRRKPPDRTG